MANINNYEYMNEKSIHEDLLCPLCTDPLQEPLSANQCGHTFCRKCITHTLRKSSKCPICRQRLTLEDLRLVTIRPFLNQLNQLFVKCKWCSQDNIQRGNFEDHSKLCTQTMVLCPAANIKCDWTGQRDEIQEHIRKCLLIKVEPMINELQQLVQQQTEQIRFLYTIFERISENHENTSDEEYITSPTIACSVCDQEYNQDQHTEQLHFGSDTDVCFNCIKKHFPEK